ncbi:MAG: hypothetical protein CMF56_12865 [Leifsonia sp.]|nr:hypothetical protein [Leifsonia sp.]HAS32841.1 hypothetical protein [Microbacterium sp.]HBR89475.1 hypothetical protein [Microbacterium sp.]
MTGTETLAEAAERIRAAVPIAGATATDDECRRRQDLIDGILRERGVVVEASVWRTAQLIDGRVVGVFATSAVEAELELAIWWESRCHWVVDDPEQRVLDEYRPVGRSRGTDRTFPLGPPRVPRDRFAPAASLLDDLAVNGRDTGFGLR